MVQPCGVRVPDLLRIRGEASHGLVVLLLRVSQRITRSSASGDRTGVAPRQVVSSSPCVFLLNVYTSLALVVYSINDRWPLRKKGAPAEKRHLAWKFREGE